MYIVYFGEIVSYGVLWWVECEMGVVVVGMGYVDGYFCNVMGCVVVFIGGEWCLVLGCICMD